MFSTIPISRITLPHGSNIIGNGNNPPWTSVLQYSQSSNATCCFHFLLQKSCFWKMGQSTVIFGSLDCERLWLSLRGPQVLVWQMILASRCPAGQRLFGLLCLSLTSSIIHYQQRKSNLLPFLLLKNSRVTLNDFFFVASFVPMKEQPNYAIQLHFILMIELFRKRKCHTSITWHQWVSLSCSRLKTSQTAFTMCLYLLKMGKMQKKNKWWFG